MEFSGDTLYNSIPCNRALAQLPTPAIAMLILDIKIPPKNITNSVSTKKHFLTGSVVFHK
jgi:hypothetical protein